MKKQMILVCVAVLGLSLVGCRGYRSEKAPIHPNPNFDWQAKVKAQSEPLSVPEGTVAWGDSESFSGDHLREKFLKEDSRFYRGKEASGAFVEKAPVTVTSEMLLRGQERFNIYCAVCHDQTGSGKGLIISRGFAPPPDLSDPRILAMKDGELFGLISHGVRTMPGYAKQIKNEEDRWAIVLYVRALQKAHNATIEDVPVGLRSNIK
jgi:mono/diheme cytochrome c family protein